jgi:NADH-quinone oxidoreductase subunit N
LFGFTGETNIAGIAASLVSGDIIGDSLVPVIIALVFVLVGFGFKVSVVPFHFWTPDVYEGAPTPVTAFVSVASKAASFALLMRFLVGVFPSTLVLSGVDVQSIWVNFIAFIAVISMTFGNVLALRQGNIKRMLAYSSIAQAGYTLVGIAALQSGDPVFGVSSTAFYLFMYTFSNLLIFAGVVLFTEATGSENIRDLAGIQRRSPWLALAMTISLLSLAGIPPAAGFFGKFFLFQAAVNSNLTGLAIIGVLNSIVALYYYLVVIKVMYVDQGKDEDQPIAITRPYAWVLGITSVVVLFLGVVPTQIIDWAREGAKAIQIALGLHLL